jgi:uncharacterized membrane protein YgdD (TMEM256/DUF423 family)
MNKNILLAGAILALFTVAIGAFGAHALQDLLLQNERTETFETAVKYQSLHALALLILGILSGNLKNVWINYAAISMVIGTIIFSGSLYILSITNITFLGAITPIGGLGMIIGWIFLILAIYRGKPTNIH